MHTDTLAELMRQASEEGAALVTVRALAEEAAEAGAARALERIGLEDEAAIGDVRQLRELLGAWRDAKRSALSSAAAWVARGLAALLLAAIAVKLGLGRGEG